MAALFALAIAIVAVTAQRSFAASRASTRPTVVLVHGAWADSSSWDGVVRRLQDAGYTVDVPANPLRGLTTDSSYLASYLSTISGSIVLVGHSYGGAVITNAATGNTQVRALVYINAFAPDSGETVGQLQARTPGSALSGNPAALFNAVPIPGAANNDVDLYVKPSVFVKAFANDLPAKTAAVLAATQRPIAYSALVTPSGAPAWKTIPSWYLVGTADNVIPPAEQELMAKGAHSHITRIKASHLSMVSQPQAVTQIIESAGNATN